MDERTSVVIGDDNADMLNVVSQILGDEFHVVASIESGNAVLDLVPRLKPDILVLDVSMGDITGFEIARQLRSGPCTSKIVFLTVHEELEFIRAAFAVGASAYVFKSRINTELKRAIRAVLKGNVFIPEAPIPQYGIEASTS